MFKKEKRYDVEKSKELDREFVKLVEESEKYPIFLDAEKNEAINKYIDHICTESQIFASLTTGKGEEHELYTLQLMSLINPKIQNFGDAAEARLRMGKHIDDEIEEVLAIRKKHIGT
jgi:uncharacterized protein (DUF1015 family)